MKTVFLIRHAAANHFEEGVEDHEKRINEEGRLQSQHIFNWLKKNNFSFDKIFSSTAKRALETTKIIFDFSEAPIDFKKSLYLCNSKDIISLLKGLDNKISNVAIVGHEPSISETLKFLVGDSRPDIKHEIFEEYPTGGISIINLNISEWRYIIEKEGMLDAYLTPQNCKENENENEKEN